MVLMVLNTAVVLMQACTHGKGRGLSSSIANGKLKLVVLLMRVSVHEWRDRDITSKESIDKSASMNG